LAKFAAVRTAPALILQGKAGSDDADELGADFMASPPDKRAPADTDPFAKP
jgi:hypothetical protein